MLESNKLNSYLNCYLQVCDSAGFFTCLDHHSLICKMRKLICLSRIKLGSQLFQSPSPSLISKWQTDKVLGITLKLCHLSLQQESENENRNDLNIIILKLYILLFYLIERALESILRFLQIINLSQMGNHLVHKERLRVFKQNLFILVE